METLIKNVIRKILAKVPRRPATHRRKLRPGIRLRVRPPTRRTPLDRLKRRLYYRKNRTKIRVQRRRYLRQHRTMLKHRKLFRRFKPTWFKKPPKPHKARPPKHFKFKVVVPKHHKKV